MSLEDKATEPTGVMTYVRQLESTIITLRTEFEDRVRDEVTRLEGLEKVRVFIWGVLWGVAGSIGVLEGVRAWMK